LFVNCTNCDRFKEDGVVKYSDAAKELVSPERCTLEVSFEDTESYNQVLATTIIEEYYRFGITKLQQL